MITEITMPSMGADMTEGTVVKWLKSEGDSIQRGDKIAEIETDKTVVEMEVYTSGTLKKIIVEAGTKVSVGKLIAYIGDAEDELPNIADSDNTNEVASAKEEITENPETLQQSDDHSQELQTSIVSDISETSNDSRIKASPMAKRLAKEKGIDISLINGSGPGGRITKNDVISYSPSKSDQISLLNQNTFSGINSEDINLSTMRQAIARVTVKSKTQIPHYYVSHEIDMTDAMLFRGQINEVIAKNGDKISVNDLIIKSLVNSLVKYPKWNSYFSDNHLKGNNDVNIGVAIALDEGLIVPAIQKCQNLSLVDISKASKDLGLRARGEGGSLSQDELTNGTFGTSNLGMFGTNVFAAIIVPPQSGILAVGAVIQKPVVRDGKIVVRSIMNATVSADHRVGDGAEAALLMKEIQNNLENPMNLLV